MKTEKGKTKGKTKRTSGRELVLRGKVGVLKQEEFLCTGKLLHRQAQGGAAKSQKTRQSRGLEGIEQRKLHFSAHKQLTDVSSTRRHAQGTEGSPQ